LSLTRAQEKAMFAKIRKPSPLSSKDVEIKSPRTGIITRLTRPEQRSTIDYDEANNRFEKFIDKTKLKAFTFDPQSKRGFNFKDIDDAIEYHEMFVVPKNSDNPVYSIGLTNQLNLTNTRELQSNFEFAKGEGFRPMFGFFQDRQNKFVDIAVAISGIPESEAIREGKKYAQDFISVIFKNGEFRLIKVE